jgi:hypothetical protein
MIQKTILLLINSPTGTKIKKSVLGTTNNPQATVPETTENRTAK